MPSLKLLADDLTGALDTAAEFVGLVGPCDVFWSAAAIPAGQESFAIDSDMRERASDEAFARARELAPVLAEADIAYKKIDSLLRGPWIAELDACVRSGLWDACLVAPAFPHQGRFTRAGQQYALQNDGGWAAVGDNILAQFHACGLAARSGDHAAKLAHGITVFDAESDADLDRAVRIGRSYGGRLLWCGSGGLAGALARGTHVDLSGILKRPVLGVFGSDHAATNAQLAELEGILVRTADIPQDLDRIMRRLGEGVALIKLETPGTFSRRKAAQHFAYQIMRLSQSLNPPATLLIAGGETLKALSTAIGANALSVCGRLEPGVPKSVIRGGSWQGVDVISKSGAFGPPDLWWRLLHRTA
jgi:D-threonate/D-erythronate kinase